MKYHPFAIWLFALVLGILGASYLGFAFSRIIYLGVLLLLVIGLILPWFRKWAGIFSIVLFVVMGAWRYQQAQSSVLPDFPREDTFMQLEIVQSLKPSEKFNKYKARVLAYQKDSTWATYPTPILFYLRKSAPRLFAGDNVWAHGKIDEIPAPKNPHQFDYQKYMRRKGIYGQMFCDTIFQVQRPSFDFKGWIEQQKHESKERLVAQGYNQNALLYIYALTLGDRSEMSPEWKQNLSLAGVMHLFAISGLHVGIVFGLLLMLGYPLLFLPHGKYIRWIMALLCVWFFAYFVGFSPSVVRASFMLSLYFVTRMMRRPTQLYHTLAVSAFVILLISPNQLFDVGFQLSYAAVFFIAWLFPIFRSWLPALRRKWLGFDIYDVFSVTLAAQLGVLPISIYYFHQFSTLFLVSNLVLLPLATLMVVTCFLVLFCSFLGIDLLVQVVNPFFDFLTQFISWVSGQNSFHFTDVHLNILQVFLLMFMVFCLRFLLVSSRYRFRYLQAFLAVVVLFYVTRWYDAYQVSKKQELWIFQQYKGNILGIRNADEMHIYWDVPDSVSAMNYTLKPFFINEGITKYRVFTMDEENVTDFYHKTRNFVQFRGKTLQLVENETDSVYAVEYVWLKDSPYQLIRSMKNKKVIADGSNYPSFIKQLQDSVGDALHATPVQGAFKFRP